MYIYFFLFLWRLLLELPLPLVQQAPGFSFKQTQGPKMICNTMFGGFFLEVYSTLYLKTLF